MPALMVKVQASVLLLLLPPLLPLFPVAVPLQGSLMTCGSTRVNESHT